MLEWNLGFLFFVQGAASSAISVLSSLNKSLDFLKASAFLTLFLSITLSVEENFFSIITISIKSFHKRSPSHLWNAFFKCNIIVKCWVHLDEVQGWWVQLRTARVGPFPNSNALQIIISVEVVAPPPLLCLLQRELINEQINQLRCKMFASSSTLGPPACASPERNMIVKVKVMWVKNSNLW